MGRRPRTRAGMSTRWVLCRLIIPLVATVLLVPPAGAQPSAVSTEFIRLTTVDGVETAGLVYAPVGRAPRGSAALVHGYASNFYSGSTGRLSRALAERGFMTIALNMRDHDAGPKTTLFEENRWDETAAVDELARRTVAPMVLVGSSLGTNRVLFYLAETQDARIRAVVLIAAPGNAFEWNVRHFGREITMKSLEQAQKLRAAGRGKELMLVDLGPLGKALYSADHLVSLRGPQTKSDPFGNIARVTAPVLLVYGTADSLAEPEVGRRLKAAATRAPRVDLVEIAGADHNFSKHRSELASVIERWLGEVLTAAAKLPSMGQSSTTPALASPASPPDAPRAPSAIRLRCNPPRQPSYYNIILDTVTLQRYLQQGWVCRPM